MSPRCFHAFFPNGKPSIVMVGVVANVSLLRFDATRFSVPVQCVEIFYTYRYESSLCVTLRQAL